MLISILFQINIVAAQFISDFIHWKKEKKMKKTCFNVRVNHFERFKSHDTKLESKLFSCIFFMYEIGK